MNLSPTAMQIGDRLIDLANPDPAQLEPAFIIPRLALLPRWQGQAWHPDGKRQWNVADHTAAVLTLLRFRGVTEQTHPELTIAAAIHDAHEVAFNDFPTPAKRTLPPAAQRALLLAEDPLALAIAHAAGVVDAKPSPEWDAINKADKDICLAEGLQFLPRIPETRAHWEQAPQDARDAVTAWLDLPIYRATGAILTTIKQAQEYMAARPVLITDPEAF